MAGSEENPCLLLLPFSPPSELEGAKCSLGRATAPAGRSPRNDTLINVFFYLFSQGLAPVCKHPAAFAESPALASAYTHWPLQKPALGRAPSGIAGRTTHAPWTFPRASEALREINLSPSEHSSVAQKWPENRKERRNGLPAKAGNSTQGGAVCRGFPSP